MNTNLMAVLSIVVVIAFLAVLVGFVQHLTQTLTRTGRNLVSALTVTTAIRQNCERIIDGVVGLNKNLNTAAAGLTGLVSSAKQRADSLSTVSRTTIPPPLADHEPRHLAPSMPGTPTAPAPSASPTRPLREPSPTRTFRQPSPTREVRREFHVRGATGQGETQVSG